VQILIRIPEQVIRHHAKPFVYPTALLTGLKQAFSEGPMRPFVDKHILAVVPVIDDVVNPILFLYSKISWHD
jgi:hypothetical protein